MNAIQSVVVRTPLLGRALLLAARTRTALRHLAGPFGNLTLWLFRSREIANFTYDLTAHNKRYLASLIADVTGRDYEEVVGYVRELESDEALKQHVKAMTARSRTKHVADAEARFGRRLGWYALARAIKPRIIVETGVDKGLGACVLTAALKKNREEGAAGYYYGTDINPGAGYLLSGDYRKFGKILYGDSIESLRSLNQTIDLFVNDSDHSSEYEAREYETVSDKPSPDAVILGDNAHRTDKLLCFALATGRRFVFFKEEPHRHWYPGAGIGIAFKR